MYSLEELFKKRNKLESYLNLWRKLSQKLQEGGQLLVDHIAAFLKEFVHIS